MILNPARLLKLAWDSTKLAGDIIAKKKEKALVLAENKKALNKYKGEEANKQLKKLFEENKYGELCRLFLPSILVDKVLDFVRVWWTISDVYWLLCCLRIILAMVPHRGYVYKEEFHQTAEVAVGDVFGIDVGPASSAAAVRSVTVNAAVFQLPLYSLKLVDHLTREYLGITLVTSYIVTTVLRLTMVGLSFIVDWCVYQICILYRHNYNQCLSVLASSIVMLAFATRTLVDSIELVLASVLTYLVAHCMKRTSETVYLQSMVEEAYEKAKNVREKVDIHKRRKLIPPHDFKHVVPISILLAVGIFNRPTFVVCAAVPLFYWFQRGVTTYSFITPFQMLNFRMFSVLPGLITTGLLVVLADSLYFGDVTWRKLWDLDLKWSDWKCCPLQFFLHGYVPGNMDKLGSRPFYYHALINVPLMFGPLGIISLVSAAQFFTEMASNEWSKKPGVRTVYALTMFTFVFAVGFLSAFPSQEPRFLMPLTLPIVLMNAHKLWYRPPWKKRKRKRWQHPLLTLWYLYNALSLVFYAYLHQGGVDEMLNQVRNLSSSTKHVNLVFSHTFPPPRFPLLLAKANNGFTVEFVDMGSRPIEDGLKGQLVEIASKSRRKRSDNYVMIPSLLAGRLAESLQDTAVQLTPVCYIFPHISIESFSEPSVIETYEDYFHRVFSFDAGKRYERFKDDIGDMGTLGYIRTVAFQTVDAVGQLGLSLLKFQLTDGESKATALEKTPRKRRKTNTSTQTKA